jgi:ADP-heptose:LPS heptosyltransferase
MALSNILILAEGQLGDLLLLTPAVRSLRAGHPRATITVIIYQRRLPRRPPGAPVLFSSEGRGTAAVMSRLPDVDRVYEVDRALLRSLPLRRRLMQEMHIARLIHADRYDGVLCTFPEDRFSVLAYLSGARVRAGEKGTGASLLLNATPSVSRSSAGVLRYYCTLAEAMGGQTESHDTVFTPSAEGLREVEAWLGREGLAGTRYVAIHPGATGEYKQWPPDRFAGLVGRLQGAGIPVALCGGKGDEEILSSIIGSTRSRVPVLEPGLDISVLAGFLMRAGVCLTNDSGPRHLAVAVGAPSIALFRRYHGREWAVYDESDRCITIAGRSECGSCMPGVCQDRVPEGARFGSACMRQIGEDEVFVAVTSMLGATLS